MELRSETNGTLVVDGEGLVIAENSSDSNNVEFVESVVVISGELVTRVT